MNEHERRMRASQHARSSWVFTVVVSAFLCAFSGYFFHLAISGPFHLGGSLYFGLLGSIALLFVIEMLAERAYGSENLKLFQEKGKAARIVKYVHLAGVILVVPITYIQDGPYEIVPDIGIPIFIGLAYFASINGDQLKRDGKV